MSRRSRERWFARQRETKMCTSKRRFDDKRAAVTAKNSWSRRRGRHGRAESVRIYPCPICKGWHMTKLETERK